METSATPILVVAIGGAALELLLFVTLNRIGIEPSQSAIMIAAVAYVIAVFGSVAWALLRAANRRAKLLCTGVRATAAILATKDTGETENDRPIVEFLLAVDAPSKANYQVCHREPIPVDGARRIAVGKKLSVIVSQTEMDKLLIDWQMPEIE